MNHPERGGEEVVYLKQNWKEWGQRKFKKGQVIHLKVLLNRMGKKRRDKGMAALHCRHHETESRGASKRVKTQVQACMIVLYHSVQL